MTDLLLRHLVDLAREERTTPKWVFVPRTQLGLILGERLLLAGSNWANFRFMTPFQLAVEMSAPHFVADGVCPNPEDLGPSLVHLLAERMPTRKAHPLCDMLGQPGTDEALWRVLYELRMSGIVPATLKARGLGELRELLRLYEDYLAEHALADRAGVFARARRARPPLASDHLLVEYPRHVWSQQERSFLDALPGQRSRPERWDLALPRRLSGLSADPGRAPAVDCDRDLLFWLTSPQQAPVARRDGTLDFFAAGRRDAEIQEIIRRVAGRAVPADSVEIACADRSALPLVMDKLSAVGLESTVEDGLPIACSLPGRALLGFLEWVERDFPAFFLRDLLLSGLLDPGSGGLSPAGAARLLDQAAVSWQRGTYAVGLRRLGNSLRERASTSDLDPTFSESLLARADQAESFAEWFPELFKHFPPPDQAGRMETATWTEGLLWLLEGCVPIRSESDGRARARLQRALRELLVLPGQRFDLLDWLRLVRGRLEGLRFGGSRPLPGMAHVTTLERAGLSGRPELFLMALEDDKVLPKVVQDALLSDRHRRELDPLLPTSTDRQDEALYLIRDRLASLEGRVTLSCSLCDLSTGSELHPSWVFFNAVRLREREIDTLGKLEQTLGEPASLVPEQNTSTGLTDWWFFRLPGGSPAFLQELASFYPDLARGQEAVAQRSSPLFTAYDGLVTEATGQLDPRLTGHPISASRLEVLAACPFRYFLERGLGLRPLQVEAPDPDAWLDAATRGEVLHEVFAAYYRDLRSKNWRPNRSRDKRRLEHLLDVELTRVRALLPAPSQSVERSEILALRRDLDRFLELETQAPAERRPIAFEVGFGLSDDFGEKLARTDPVRLDFENFSLSLRGRIDRIDRVGDNEYEVVDYKTGAGPGADRNALYAGGRLLQHALYALVAEQLLEPGARILRSSYYMPTTRAKQTWQAFPPPDREHMAQVLDWVLAPMASGAFFHSDQPERDCQYCDFRRACGAHQERNRTKLENGENELLEFRRRLEDVR